MKIIMTLTIILFAAMTVTDKATAQGCCTAGSCSLGGIESGVMPYQTLSIGVNYQYNSLTRAFNETDRIEDLLRRTASVGYFTMELEYGFQPRLSIVATLNYNGKSRELTIQSNAGGNRFTETASFRSSGVGDLILLAKYQLIPSSIVSPFELAIGGGASLPTGSFTNEQNNAQLSIDLQPGTGATGLLGWAFALRSFPSLGLRLYASTMYRYAGTNFDGYRIGDEIVVILGSEYNLSENFSASLNLRARFAGRDYANRRILSATGGSYHDFMPALSYVDGPSTVRVFGQVPVYRNVKGIQLTLAYVIGVEYRYAFDFRSEGSDTNGE